MQEALPQNAGADSNCVAFELCNAVTDQSLAGEHLPEPDYQQPCSLDLAVAPTFSQHDYDLLAMLPGLQPSKAPCQQLPPTPAPGSTAAMSIAKNPVPRNVSMTMRARPRQGPALASYLSTHVSNGKDRPSPAGLGYRSATACSSYTTARPGGVHDGNGDDDTSAQDSNLSTSLTAIGSMPDSMPEPPVFEDLVQPPRQAAGHVTPALRFKLSLVSMRVITHAVVVTWTAPLHVQCQTLGAVAAI